MRIALHPLSIALGAPVLAFAPGCSDTASRAKADLAPPLTCPAASGEARDLVAVARLSADKTRAGIGWPREDRDGIATVRDDDEATAYRPPDGEHSTVRIDLAPALGRAVRVDAIEARVAGSARIDVALLESCGGRPIAIHSWEDPASALDLGSTCATCIELRIDADTEVALDRLRLTSRDAELPDVGGALGGEATRPPAPSAHASSGVVEGFYGLPWTWAERLRMIDSLAASGMGTYLYAPKDEPLHRSRWREPYDDATRARFAALGAFARDRGVRFLFGVSPFIDFDANGDADLRALVTKLEAVLDAGASGVVLLADDIEGHTASPIDGALGASHVETIHRVRDALKSSHPNGVLAFVPTVYSDERAHDWPGGDAYLAALSSLDKSIDVIWTGPHTSDATLAASDFAGVRASIGREPTLWDNFWANDGDDGVIGRILLGPYSGRAPDLVSSTRGILLNPSMQGALSRLSVATAGSWLNAAASGSFDPARARREAATLDARFAMTKEQKTDDAELLAFVMEVFDGNANARPVHAGAAAALAQIESDIDGGRAPNAEDWQSARTTFARMTTLPSDLHHSTIAVDTVDELLFPAAKAAAEGAVGLAVIDMIAERWAGRPGDDAKLDAALRASGASSRFVWGEGLLQSAADRARARALQAHAFTPPPEGDALPECVAGNRLQFAPFARSTRIEAFGMPGARVEDDAVVWSPPHAGTFDVTILGFTDEPFGFAARHATVVCVPPRKD